ncbi:hypothetical protein HYX13_00995 [Candidatus Woesearchaeota archaeon]|nr:hypothetical protein [Candidatus Woesearchaeota archaeon]
MRLTSKKIEEILVSIIGEDGTPLIRELQRQNNISEFHLATKTKKDIKVIRRMLYVLYNNNLVSFNRKKDKEKGWYIYYWTLVPESVKYCYFKKKREQLERQEHRLEEEKKELFFTCQKKCIRLNFDQSTDFEFRCPECGELLSQDATEEKIASLEKEVKLLRGELAHEKESEAGKTAKKAAAQKLSESKSKKEVTEKKKGKAKKTKVKKKK